jgi:2-amino-4-hydroxy-6-hydroxymethyldihydropteridine diphosphokinase
MNMLHRAYFSIGSNIDPEENVPSAISLLKESGRIAVISRAWETHSVGAKGPNFINVTVLLITAMSIDDIKQLVIRPIENKLGRKRTNDKFAPRTIDLDLLIYDRHLLEARLWNLAFLAVPTSEIAPDFRHPITGERLDRAAYQLKRSTWTKLRVEILSQSIWD